MYKRVWWCMVPIVCASSGLCTLQMYVRVRVEVLACKCVCPCEWIFAHLIALSTVQPGGCLVLSLFSFPSECPKQFEAK